METAQGEEQTIENLTRRVLIVNFAAIHTYSIVSPNLYLHIIPCTELIGGIPVIRACPLLFGRLTRIRWALRAEVEQVIEREGWTKDALDLMYKVDSFIKELQRKTQLGNRTCRSTLCMLYADRNSRHDASCQKGLHILR